MASQLSHKSVVEICTLIRRYNADMPNTEWRFAAKHCVVPKRGDPGDFLPAEYLSSDGFRISVGKYTLSEAVDAVFSPGDTPLLLTAAPEGFIEGVLERYRNECKESFYMRNVTITGVNITSVWINAFYTSFPCRRCSSPGDSRNKHVVFHLTPPDAQRCLSLRYCSRWLMPGDRRSREHLEVVNCWPDCQRPLLRLSDLRREALRFLPRVDLDTCLLVNVLWSADVAILSTQLALRKLHCVAFHYDGKSQTMDFDVATEEAELFPTREFTLSRNAIVDSAIVVNHLRNCASTYAMLFEFSDNDEVNGLELDAGIHQWTSQLFRSMEKFNFHVTNFDLLGLDRVRELDAADFMFFTRDALQSCTNSNGLRNVSLHFNFGTLDNLAAKRFLQWPSMQKLEKIDLTIWRHEIFLPDITWIRGLFQLPNCQTIVVRYVTRGGVDGIDAPDCSEHIFVILQEIIKQFEHATDVSGFPKVFEFLVEQEELTWDHQEPTPTYSNVPAPLLKGPWNVYVTKNQATDVPLSVFVNTKKNCRGMHDSSYVARRFICRMQLYNHELVKASRSRKRCLQ